MSNRLAYQVVSRQKLRVLGTEPRTPLTLFLFILIDLKTILSIHPAPSSWLLVEFRPPWTRVVHGRSHVGRGQVTVLLCQL